MNFKFDCVYYWNGCRSMGRWYQADAGTRDALRTAGYYAIDGKMAIGSPETPPNRIPGYDD